jgi:phage-related protein
MVLTWHRQPLEELESAETSLRARCKAHLIRLAEIQPGKASGLRLEKVAKGISELKVSWNKQEYRFLFSSIKGEIFILVFFNKKTRKTPTSIIDLAESRMREIELDRAVNNKTRN